MALGAPTLGGAFLWRHSTTIQLSRRECRLAGLRPPRPIRLLHLSDLHASPVVPDILIEQAIDQAVALKPDLFCLTGDYVTARAEFDFGWYQSQLRRLSAIAPSFAVMGNHDGGVWAARTGGFESLRQLNDLLQSSGIQLLPNANTVVEAAGARLQLAGVGDLWAQEVDGQSAFHGLDPRLPSILLAHNPDTKAILRDYPWQLMLSGHTHGGQIVVPGLGAPLAPVKDHRYLSGVKPWGERWIHVTTGIGNVGGLRFNCAPEIALLSIDGA